MSNVVKESIGKQRQSTVPWIKRYSGSASSSILNGDTLALDFIPAGSAAHAWPEN